MIDLSTAPPPPDSPGSRMPRRQLLISGLCGLVGGSGGALATVLLAAPERLNPPAGNSVASVEPAEAREQFVDLATVGPAVTVDIGRSGRCSVTVGATVNYGSADDGTLSQGGALSFEATGANRREPRLDGAARSFLSVSGIEVPFAVTQSFASTTVLERLHPGPTTFTVKYLVEGGSPVPVYFRDRTILVTPLRAKIR
jgi:hypothetical protein